MRLLAIDPGAHLIGAAVFSVNEGHTLEQVEVVRFKHVSEIELWFIEKRWGVDKIVVEVPQVYPTRGKADPNDLIPVALTAGACLSISSSSIAVRPHEWKGSIDKKVHQARLLKGLSERDRAMIDAVKPASLRHNAIDALGLGLWLIGRS